MNLPRPRSAAGAGIGHPLVIERRLTDEPKTLEDLSSEYGISRERVRQIEVRAFEKVQSAVKHTIAKAEAATMEAAH